ncbi:MULTISPECIES: hypothetical protein [unclassified Microbacterium]|uniref:hypothetical protein n=1 Tax=unclassified Microbacterium TaxID=2609290 RepID=UPI00387051BB
MDGDTTNANEANAEPTGGWQSGGAAGGETTEPAGAADLASKEAADEVDRGRSGAPASLAPDGTPDGAADAFVESAEIQQGLDPDVLTDEQADQR